ncbi:MAG: class I tRNA ligase family protein, partial [Bacilli bacterium]|nr:class I tRNA ligase family protein [Bacilli bacterium]
KELSLEELKDEEIDLHRPYVDDIHIKCEKCGKTMNRVVEVLDVWFDSGIMPYGQFHYPFENKELFESQFPASFISEGIDQTRGWFYVLLVISTFIMGESPFKNVLVNDLLLDAEGKKMSKSRGNIVEPFSTLKEYGADTVRFYLLYVSPVWTPLKFDIKGLNEVHSKFFNPLKNTYNFFTMYANTDNIDPRDYEVEYKDREEIDKWLLSKYNKLVKNVLDSYEEYDLNKVTKYLAEFVSEDLSNWYIRRNRNRFWSSELDNSKKAVYKTTYEVLLGLTKLLAPISPYVSEEIFRKLTDKESVHLELMPEPNLDYIDLKLEEKMDLVRDLISLGRYVREENKIKVRQPLSEVIFDNKYKKLIGDMDNLVKEELNVKKVTYEKDIHKYMNIEYRPNYKEVGKVFGSNMKAFADYLLNIKDKDVDKLNKDKLEVTLNGTDYKVTTDMVETRISSKEGYNVAVENNRFVILNTELTTDLLNEGLARETVSKVQQLRKSNNFEVTDRIKVYCNANKEYMDNLKDYLDFVKEETLCVEFIPTQDKLEEVDVNDYKVGFKLEKVK